MRILLSKAVETVAACLLVAAAASGSALGATFSIGGKVTGLKAGVPVTLADNKVDKLVVKTDGSFTFKTKLATGAAYSVTVAVEPAGQMCKVTNGSGKVKTSNVTNVAVACENVYSIGGKVSGLKTAESVTLVDNKVDKLVVKANGSFAFKTKLTTGAAYSVAVSVQPAGQICTVAGATGKVKAANITSVAVTCANVYSIGGTIKGLPKGETITLADKLSATVTDTVSKSGLGTSIAIPFTFPKELTNKSTYSVSVKTQPAGEKCSVSGGSGTVAAKNVTTVVVTCTATTPTTYSIGGTISWPSSGVTGSVTLATNSESVSVPAGTASFTFPTKLASTTKYSVSVTGQPTGGSCSVTGGASGTIGTSNVTNVAVTCTASGGGGGSGFWIPYEAKSQLSFSIGGTVSWPASGVTGSVTLEDNSTDIVTVPEGTTSFTFTNPLTTGTQYSITIPDFGQPTGGTCTVSSNATGVMDTTAITNIAVTCTATSSSAPRVGGGSLGIRRAARPLSRPATGRTLPFVHSETTGTGSTGLFLIPSGKITSSPAPTWITTDPVKLHAIGVNIDFGSAGLTTYDPKLIVYSDTDFSGNTKIYGLDISDTSTTPTPVQISSLALDSTKEICSGSQGQVNLSDPTSIFVVFDIAPTGTCNFGTSDTYWVVHYTDSSSTAATQVSLDTNSFDELYNDGTQSGILVWDETANTVSLYADETFKNPKTVFSNVSLALADANGLTKKGYTTETSNLFYTVSTTATPSVTTLYLIDSSGSPTQVFQGPVGSTASDDNNFYFVSTTGNTTKDTSTLYQVALTGGKPTALYVGPATITTGSPAATYILDYELTGSNDSVLIYSASYGSILSSATTTLYNVPVGASTKTPTTIATYPSSEAITFLGNPGSGKASDDVLFVSYDTITGTEASPVFTWSSVAFPAGGPYTAKPVADSYYGDLGILTSNVGGTTWRVKGITDTRGGFDGGTVYLTNIGTLVDTAVKTTGGGNYSFALPTSPNDRGYSGFLIGLSNFGVAVGDFDDISGDTYGSDIGVAVDTTNNFLYAIKLPNTDVDF